MNTKKSVFFVACITMVILVSLFFVAQTQYCNYRYDGYETSCMRVLGYIERVLEPLSFALFLAPLLFILSLITYFMRDEVFRAWWRFARWFAPVIIAVTLLLENAGGGGGIGISGAVSAAFDILILGVLYAVLIITSLVKVFNVYFKTKKHDF